MPIRIRLDEILVERRMSLAELADRVGISAENLAVLRSGEARAIRFATLAVLCRELGCEPGDLLVYEPEGEAAPTPDPPP
jgi:putative transcriptional regulator